MVRPFGILLEDSDDPVSVRLDGSSSFSRGGGDLSYQWELNSTLVSVKSETLSAPILLVQAQSGVKDTRTIITLKVIDTIGQSDIFTVPVVIKAKPEPVQKDEVDAFFKA